MAGDNRLPARSRRAFAASCLIVVASTMLSGCSFSLRELLESPARLDFDGNRSGFSAPDSPSSEIPQASPSSAGFPAAEGGRYGFWMDTRACVGCGSCVSACRKASLTPEDEEGRRRLVLYEMDDGEERRVSLSCLHCAEPACVRVCPAGAVQKRADGIVTVDREACIGCRYCRQACPFDVPRYIGGTMDKCDCCLCAGVAPGGQPHCVKSCPTGALKHGELDELRSLSGGRAFLLEAPTDPSLLVS